MSDADAQLDALRASLLSGRPRRFAPEEGADAFRAHKLLATDVHRAAKVNARREDKSETEQWVRYVTEHFPEGRNSEADARLLWTDWRTALVKRSTLGPGVGVTHGQSHAHWYREPGGSCASTSKTCGRRPARGGASALARHEVRHPAASPPRDHC